jgi:hypothetical protein
MSNTIPWLSFAALMATLAGCASDVSFGERPSRGTRSPETGGIPVRAAARRWDRGEQGAWRKKVGTPPNTGVGVLRITASNPDHCYRHVAVA